MPQNVNFAEERRKDGHLAAPNFKLYFLSFMLWPLLDWFDPL